MLGISIQNLSRFLHMSMWRFVPFLSVLVIQSNGCVRTGGGGRGEEGTREKSDNMGLKIARPLASN